MKRIFIISLTLCCFCITGYSQATANPPIQPPPLLSNSRAIDCIQNNSSVILCFNQSLGDVTVAIWGNTLVYSNKQYAFTGNIQTISTGSWSNATYAICVTNSKGKVIATFTVPIQK